jgi:PAS domain S-box-containing protein
VSRFLQVLETAPDAMVIMRADGIIDLVNAQAERMFGYARGEMLGHPIELLIPERLRAAHTAHRTHFANAPVLRPMGSGLELSGRRKDGSEFPVEISLGPLETEEGRFVSAAIRDITERKRLEAASRAANELLAQSIEIMEDAFAVFSRDDRLLVHNSAFRALFPVTFKGPLTGLSPAELVDRSLPLLPFESDELRARARGEYLAIFEPPTGSYTLNDGRRTLRVATRRTLAGERVMTIADRTDDELRAEELRRASAAKSDFLSSMSHELRTPLNAILGFASLLLRDRKVPLPDRHREMADHILRGGQHLLKLVDEVLDLAKVESGHAILSPEPVGVAEVLAEVTSTLSPMAARLGIELRIDPLPDALPMVIADRTRFAQVLMNLGSNAIKYGRKGGHATFVASRLDTDFVRVSVVDDGIGIPEDKHDRIFQPFQRAGQESGPIEGTGIGLALSRRLTELMGGRVSFHSAYGKGSEFDVDLRAHERPAARPSPEAIAEVGSVLASSHGPRIEVVYVEDNPSNVAFMRALLADFERVELHVAPTAEIGVEVVRARRPRVVIMDINLPGMSGFEALRLLKVWPETRDIPVIALSAAAMDRDVKRAEAAGFYRYVTKPVNVGEMIALLEELLVTAPQH